jgi:single-stranded-DNA-specific exonuclease
VPAFCDTFTVLDQRIVGGRHRKLRLERPGAAQPLEAIQFGEAATLPGQIRCVYRLGVNDYNGNRSAQLILEHCTPV